MKFLRKFLLSLTLERLVLTEEDKAILKTFSKAQRQVAYRWFNHLAYAANDESVRAASIWLRNEFMKDTQGKNNGFEEERHLIKPKNNDFLPNVLKHEF